MLPGAGPVSMAHLEVSSAPVLKRSEKTGAPPLRQLLVCVKLALAVMEDSVTVPPPVFVTVTACGWLVVLTGSGPKLRLVGLRLRESTTLKVAVTDWTEFMVTTQEPMPEQAPDQPAKAEPELAAAVSVTEAPALKLAEQVPGQLMPEGELVTVPEPEPASVTLSA